ncbi:MAG: hypothetical protein ACLTYH_07560 [Streptococcus salivarius]
MLHHKLQQHQKQQAHQQLNFETAQASTSEAPQAGNSSEAEKPRVRSRRALSPANGISTRSFDSELQDAAQKTAIYSPGKRGKNKVTQVQFGSIVMVQSITITKKMQNVLLMLMFTFSM